METKPVTVKDVKDYINTNELDVELAKDDAGTASECMQGLIATFKGTPFEAILKQALAICDAVVND